MNRRSHSRSRLVDGTKARNETRNLSIDTLSVVVLLEPNMGAAVVYVALTVGS